MMHLKKAPFAQFLCQAPILIFHPQHTKSMPVVKIGAFLELEQNRTLFKRITQNFMKEEQMHHGII